MNYNLEVECDICSRTIISELYLSNDEGAIVCWQCGVKNEENEECEINACSE